MIYSQKILAASGACQPGQDFCGGLNYDWPVIYAQCPNPDWLLWWLAAAGQITAAQLQNFAASFEQWALPHYQAAFPDSPVDNGIFQAAQMAKQTGLGQLAQSACMSARIARSYGMTDQTQADFIRKQIPCPFTNS